MRGSLCLGAQGILQTRETFCYTFGQMIGEIKWWEMHHHMREILRMAFSFVWVRGGKIPHLYSPVVSTLWVCDTRDLSGIEDCLLHQGWTIQTHYLYKQLWIGKSLWPVLVDRDTLTDQGSNKIQSPGSVLTLGLFIYFLLMGELTTMVQAYWHPTRSWFTTSSYILLVGVVG